MTENKDKNFTGLHALLHSLKDKFDLNNEDKATQAEVVESISKGVEFKGTNLWVLTFATMVASLGLNVNSTAVIIGAMLISPLMGPIMGIGLSLGINNFELMKRSLRNFGLMVIVGILTSMLYFLLSPLSTAQSELLARTEPSLYDVLIAFFGGLAGIVAQSRKDRGSSMVIPGVAIATALMPPLCTAGFGLATGQFNYFIGAFYLFFINTVFIATATYIIVRFLKYDKKVFLDKARERKVKHYMLAIVLITIAPSILLAYNIVQRSLFESNADKYVASVFIFDNAQVVDYRKKYKTREEGSKIDIVLIGESLSHDVIDNCRAQLPAYGLTGTRLVVRQSDGPDDVDVNTLSMSYVQLIDEKNRQISEMERRLSLLSSDMLPYADISRETGTIFDNMARMSLSRQLVMDAKGVPVDTVLICVVKLADGSAEIDRKKLSEWLTVRTGSEQVKIFME